MRHSFSFVLGIGLSLSILSGAQAYEAYISNEKSNTVTVIDTDKLQVIKTIKVGRRPRGIGITHERGAHRQSAVIHKRYRIDAQRVFAGRQRHRLRRHGETLRIVQKRVDLINCDGAFEAMAVPI